MMVCPKIPPHLLQPAGTFLCPPHLLPPEEGLDEQVEEDAEIAALLRDRQSIGSDSALQAIEERLRALRIRRLEILQRQIRAQAAARPVVPFREGIGSPEFEALAEILDELGAVPHPPNDIDLEE